ncbi:hypothetical protein ABK040_008566 [Willaertia magna]
MVTENINWLNFDQDFVSRLQFFIIPNNAENSYNINLPQQSLEYYFSRINELNTIIEQKILLRMNVDNCKTVDWRQNLVFTLPNDLTALLFFVTKLNVVKPILIKSKKQHIKDNRSSSEGRQLDIHIFTWKSNENNLLPPLATKYWYLKKWMGCDEVMYRAECKCLTFVFKPQLHYLRIEFTYTTEFYNTKLNTPAWQYC